MVQADTLTRAAPDLRVISLGGGVQSTVLALMADAGEFGDMPDVAIFADTGWEPEGVYEIVRWLGEVLSFPVVTTSNGRSLREDAHEGVSNTGQAFVTIPVFTLSPLGAQGMQTRQCTSQYKIRPIHHAVKRHLGVDPAKPDALGYLAWKHGWASPRRRSFGCATRASAGTSSATRLSSGA